jgi:hypothetical protein
MDVRNDQHDEAARLENPEPFLQGADIVGDMFVAMAAVDRVLALVVERKSNAIIAWIVYVDPDGVGNDGLSSPFVPCKPDIKDIIARKVFVENPLSTLST